MKEASFKDITRHNHRDFSCATCRASIPDTQCVFKKAKDNDSYFSCSFIIMVVFLAS